MSITSPCDLAARLRESVQDFYAKETPRRKVVVLVGFVPPQPLPSYKACFQHPRVRRRLQICFKGSARSWLVRLPETPSASAWGVGAPI